MLNRSSGLVKCAPFWQVDELHLVQYNLKADISSQIKNELIKTKHTDAIKRQTEHNEKCHLLSKS